MSICPYVHLSGNLLYIYEYQNDKLFDNRCPLLFTFSICNDHASSGSRSITGMSYVGGHEIFIHLAVSCKVTLENIIIEKCQRVCSRVFAGMIHYEERQGNQMKN